jgi:hypothetical protein
MSAKTVFTCALVLSLIGFRTVQGQGPGVTESVTNLLPPSPQAVQSLPQDPPPELQIPSLSSWILNPRCEPIGPFGRNGPIKPEIYLRSGIDVPVGGGRFMDTLQTGWTIAGGVRSLFYNAPGDAAWVIDFGILNSTNHGKRPDTTFPLSILVPPSTANVIGANNPQRVNFGTDPGVPGVTNRRLNRTYFTFGGGREWSYQLSFLPQHWFWRWGFDGGGRFGSERMDFNEIRHRTDTIGALYAAAHSDIEIPINCAVLYFGFRVEYAYTWADILQDTTNADVQDLNFLFTVGLRF